MEKVGISDEFVNLKATELRLGLLETEYGCKEEKQLVSCGKSNKRALLERLKLRKFLNLLEKPKQLLLLRLKLLDGHLLDLTGSTIQAKNNESESQRMYVKVSMDGAPYLRKIDLTVYKQYPKLLESLQNMFKENILRENEIKAQTMCLLMKTKLVIGCLLVMSLGRKIFVSSCKRLRIMKGSEVKDLGYGVQ